MKITKQDYIDAIEVIKAFEIQENSRLPYEMGHVRYGSRWSHAKRNKKTGEVYEIYMHPVTKETHSYKTLNKSVIESFNIF
jgi:hypothetical protein